MPEDFVTPEEIIAELKIAKSTLYGWIRRGILPAVKVGDLYRIRRADYEAFKRPTKKQSDDKK